MHAKSYFWLKPFNLERVGHVLVRVSFIGSDESVVGALDNRLAPGVTEVHFFEVVDEHVLFDVFNSLHVATLINT